VERVARRTLLIALVLGVQLISCAARVPALEEVNDVVLQLREYRMWAWALGIGAICADLALPVPQTAVIAALGILYGIVGGGLLGSVGLIAGGLLGYALARRYGRGPVARLVSDRSLGRVESLFDRAGVWAIVLTRSLPYGIPEAVVCAAGLGGMQASKLLVALSLGSIPTAFVFSAIGAGWDEQPALALAISYALPIPLLPLVLYLMRGRAAERGTQ
jgi:uncharacterized membrane protein YdjX (TVP38/TMEM64 family)